jgi:tryptophanyl-tRNA synthetase
LDETFEPYRERRAALEANPDEVEDVLREGARRARAAVEPVLAAAREAVGLETMK